MRAKKSLGQHFLTNKSLADTMVSTAGISEGEVVLEVGPGKGILTNALLRAGAEVLAVEADKSLIPILEEQFETALTSGQLRLFHGDVLTIEKSALGLSGGAYAVVANIPYYITGSLFRFFLENEPRPHTLTFLVQKEVAKRIARSEKGSLLAMSIRAFGDPVYAKTVGKGNFSPPPKVDSAIVIVTSISADRLNDVSVEHFFTFLKAGFSHKRKVLRSNILHFFDDTGDLLSTFKTLSIQKDIRAEDMSFSDWVALAKCTNETSRLSTKSEK